MSSPRIMYLAMLWGTVHLSHAATGEAPRPRGNQNCRGELGKGSHSESRDGQRAMTASDEYLSLDLALARARGKWLAASRKRQQLRRLLTTLSGPHTSPEARRAAENLNAEIAALTREMEAAIEEGIKARHALEDFAVRNPKFREMVDSSLLRLSEQRQLAKKKERGRREEAAKPLEPPQSFLARGGPEKSGKSESQPGNSSPPKPFTHADCSHPDTRERLRREKKNASRAKQGLPPVDDDD